MPSPEASAPQPATGYQKLAEVEAQLGAERTARESLEARLVSPEIQALNNNAELAIFGSRGHTTGYVDPAGNKLQGQILGKVDLIRRDPHAGKTEADREAAANQYQADVEGLVNEGFELCQAKLIMDKREERTNDRQDLKKFQNKLIKHYMDNDPNMTGEGAQFWARKRLSKRVVDEGAADQDIKDLIRTNGIFTADELTVATGGTIHDPDAPTEPLTPEGQHQETEAERKAREEQENMAELERLTGAADVARAYYSWIKSSRARAHNPVGRFRRKNLKAAKEALETHTRAQFEQEKKILLSKGISEEDLEKKVAEFAIGDAEKLAQTMYTERLLASGKYQIHGNHHIKQVKRHPSILERNASKLFGWLEEQAGVDPRPPKPTIFPRPHGSVILGESADYVETVDDISKADVKKVTDKVMKQKGVIVDNAGNTVKEGYEFATPNPELLKKLKRNKGKKTKKSEFSDGEKALIRELGMYDLKKDEKRQLLQRLYGAQQKNLGVAILDSLSDTQLQEFNRLQAAGDNEATQEYLNTAVPNQDVLAAEQWKELIDTVKSGSKQMKDVIRETSKSS